MVCNVENSFKKNIILSRLIILVTYIIVNLMFVVIIQNIDKERWLHYFFYITAVQLITNIYFLKGVGFKVFSLPILFVIYTYIFHLGHLVLIEFNIDVERPFDVINMVSHEVFIRSCMFVFYSQIFLVMGILICNITKSKIKNKSYIDDKIQIEVVKKIGYILFGIGIIPKLYIDIKRIILYISGDYLSTYTVGISGMFGIVGNFAETAVIMMLLGSRDNNKKAKIIYLLALAYQVIVMLTGNRGRPTVYILCLTFIYINVIEKINIKKFIIFTISGVVGLALINFIGDIRMAKIKDINELINTFINSFNIDLVYEMLGEFGGTLITLSYSIMFFPKLVGFQYGYSYLASLLMLFPNIGGVLEPFRNQFIFVGNFPRSYRFALGGSYLGEIYYNFGDNGIYVIIVVGIIIGIVSRKINNYIKESEWLKLSIIMVLFPNILWWVRSYFSDMVRDFTWTTMIIIFLYIILKSSITETCRGMNNTGKELR